MKNSTNQLNKLLAQDLDLISLKTKNNWLLNVILFAMLSYVPLQAQTSVTLSTDDAHLSFSGTGTSTTVKLGSCAYLWNSITDHSLLKFDESSIPAGVVINSATLNLNHYDNTGTSSATWGNLAENYDATAIDSKTLSSSIYGAIDSNIVTLKV